MGEKVLLYVYDLSQGLAKNLSLQLLGKQVDGIWHTGVVVGNSEYYFGGGIQKAPRGGTYFGQPVQVIELGETEVPEEIRDELIEELSGQFREETYNLLSNNCNNFSNELAMLLTGNGIPEHILALPDDVLSTPLGRMIQPMLTQMQAQLGRVKESNAPVVTRQAAPRQAPSSQTPAQPTTTPPARVKKEEENKSQQRPDAKAEFDMALKREYAAIVAQGNISPNQAAIMALERVREKYIKRQAEA